MFEKIEDVPRTPSGALRDQWAESLFAGWIAYTMQALVEFQKAQIDARLNALSHEWHMITPSHEVCKLGQEKLLDAATAGAAENLNPDDAAKPQIQDVRAALNLIANWGKS